MMSISFGGLGIMSLRRPFSELAGIVLGKGDIQSMLCLVVFCIVSFVLAYLTNPSENSFRAYLTELSFRQHLSRLDDNTDDDSVGPEKLSNNHLLFRTGTVDPHHTLPFDNRSPFHFANRASVSLRTPKHVFHSFGIFTIAAIIPLAKTDPALQEQRDTTAIADSWFIGAFGKWWRGGVFETWYQDVIARSGDEESWSSGILGMKTLDRHNELNALPGLPFSTRNLPPHGLSRGSPPRLRNREKSSQRNTSVPLRSSSPPPLPKSVSLPLHAPRITHSPPERNGPQTLVHSHSSSAPSEHIIKPTATTPSLFDQSPPVVELLQEISASKSTILELRAQLNETQSAASQSHASLQADLVSFRERKRQEDVAKNDLKSRTKAIEDSKRAAESLKRDAEKRLRSAESARNDAAQRLEHLDKEIVQLQNRLADDTALLADNQDIKSEAEQGLVAELEHKKKEIQVAENVVAALGLRARELEDRLAEKKARIRSILERVEARKQEQALLPSSPVDHFHPWSSASDLPDHRLPVHSRDTSGYAEPLDTDFSDDVSLSHSDEIILSRPSRTSLNLVSNVDESSFSTGRLGNQGQGYFDRPMNILSRPSLPLSFSPFDEMPQTPAVVISPSTSSSLISSSFISTLDNVDGLSRSFQSDSDIFLERDWREKDTHDSHQVLQMPEGNATPAHLTVSPTEDGFYPLRRNKSDPSASGTVNANLEPTVADKSHNRHWFSLSTKTKAKKGLNPDAKVFDFNRFQTKPASATTMPVMPSVAPLVYDALNPNGLGSKLTSSTTADSNFLRAFAPSPAEREALQRALGGSSNGSLERLPSLSDVGSIPSSPSHIHAKVVDRSPPLQQPQRHVPSWLQSLPRIRKPNFSPWDDDELTPTANGSGSHRSVGGGMA
ncbi:hypothetical protein DFH05DRAFT_1475347 [Lentinula detonsa]|uniref:Proteophosphoglycan ppg4 n=1 Tax=Lentinula detonsa TaxID=2804962 RepID=A0A9W8P8G3_9AGAR|nr:hypothetical protein DFH05DRAFT_1475347 [Lentinula detonsa]